uniref:Tobamovirus multiplication protein 2B n=1 Tax=Tanacetum cinerariifolium TaxID=118510 RepID=A0A6L2MRU7_TANCI|nr:hypothetical protein [Tanacetum cinerariifolium]
MSSSSSLLVGESGKGRSSSSAKSLMVSDQISQAVLSTSNLLNIMRNSSPSQDKLVKLPKNLLSKASSIINNTKQVLDQMPLLISSLDAHMDHGLQSVPHLETVTRLLSNIENNQLKPLTDAQLSSEESLLDTSDRTSRPEGT